MSLKIAICDDERVEAQNLQRLVTDWARDEKRPVHITTYESAESFLFAHEADRAFDILLLDIQMREMDGVTLAKKLRDDDQRIQILFITGFPDFIAEGYEVSAVHYLMKPVDERKLRDVLKRACDRLGVAERSILLELSDGAVRIPLRDILYAEAFTHTVVVHTAAGPQESRMPFGQFEKLLDARFFRCHRSYIVNLSAVSRITGHDAVLDNGAVVPISRRLHGAFTQAFITFYKGMR